MKHQLEIQYKNEVSDFLKGMLIGDKNGLSDEVKDDFKESGLIHLLAVSGLHISLAGRRVYKLVDVYKRQLTQHKDAEVVWYGSRSYIDQKYYEVFRNMFQIVDDKCLDDNMDELASKVDVIFTATPQGLCSSLVSEEILSKVKIIDLSADFRIKDVNRYEEWYGIKHQSPEFIDEAVYGLCEINREDIKKARLIANPGCYPTCSCLLYTSVP